STPVRRVEKSGSTFWEGKVTSPPPADRLHLDSRRRGRSPFNLAGLPSRAYPGRSPRGFPFATVGHVTAPDGVGGIDRVAVWTNGLIRTTCPSSGDVRAAGSAWRAAVRAGGAGVVVLVALAGVSVRAGDRAPSAATPARVVDDPGFELPPLPGEV